MREETSRGRDERKKIHRNQSIRSRDIIKKAVPYKMYEKMNFLHKFFFREFFPCFNSYSAIRGGDKSNKSKIIKIGPAVLEL